MKDNEFYQGAELWPQPPDERPTLESDSFVPGKTAPRKTGSDKKKRRKLTDSLSSLVIGALAVVMVATAVATTIDDKEYGGLGGGDICETCGIPDCPYWDYGNDDPRTEGLRIYFSSSIIGTVGDDLYSMPAHASSDSTRYHQGHCIYTQDSKRVILTVNPGYIPFNYGMTSWSNAMTDDCSAYPAQEDSHVSICVAMSDPNLSMSESADHYLCVQLLYSPEGSLPELGFGLGEGSRFTLEELPYSYTALVDGYSNVWIRAYSNINQQVCDYVMNYCTVKTAAGDNLLYPLGQTMHFQETEDVRRIWRDEWSVDVIEHLHVYNGISDDNPVFFNSAFMRKTYSVWSRTGEAQISLTQTPWPDIFETWDNLNAEAPSRGHHVIFHHKQLENYSCNGIEYEVHMAYVQTEADFYEFRLILVPVQEKNIGVIFRLYYNDLNVNGISKIDQVLEESETDAAYILTLLEQLSLRPNE